MGLPQIDFRVPEATWFKSAFAGRFGGLAGKLSVVPGLSSTGALAWPYKIAVVSVMALVACGTLVTFGSAGAETPSASAEVAALPGSDEASPTVEGQVIPPPSAALLNSADLLSTLNLTDYTPYDLGDLSSSNDDDDDDRDDEDSDDEDTKSDIKKKLAATNPTPSASAGGSSGSDSDDEGSKHKQWRADVAQWEKAHAEWEADMKSYESEHDAWESSKSEYETCLNKNKLLGQKLAEASCKTRKPGDEPDAPSEPAKPSEPDFES